MAETNGESLTDIEKKIIRQIEHYFGDVNLARDKFLQEQIKADDGWVLMKTMLTFNRLKTISDDNKLICDAIKKSKSGLMEVNEDSTKIRRSPLKPLPENTRERRDDLNNRTMYVKGFPKTSTLDELLSFFDKHGKIENLVMRKDMEKKFKGSVFAVFIEKDDFNKFLDTETIKYEDSELIKLSKDEYFKSKTEKKRKLKEEQMKEKQERQLKKMEEEKVNIVPGSILHVAGFTEDLERDDIKNFFSDHGHVAWVDYNTGDKEAWIRFDGENSAVEILEKVKDSESEEIKLRGNVLKGDVLEGEAEEEHWRKISLSRMAASKNPRKNPYKNKRGWEQHFREIMAETNGESLTDIEKKIIRQIEHYFGDINLAWNKFLQEQIKADHGWVLMKTMLTFNRLKTISDDNKLICDAIKKSKSGLMEVNKDSTKIRRSPLKPLPENTRERRVDLKNRTMYVKGFPKTSTLDELLAFFDKHGKIENLVMRRDMEKKFKRSVFAVFIEKDDFNKFLDTETIKYEDSELIKLSKDEYFKSKTEKRRKLEEEQMKEKQERQLKKIEEGKVNIVPGSILHVAEFTEDLERDDIKNFFSDHGHVAWVDYNTGDKEAWIRFDGENSAVEILEKVKDSESEEIKLRGNVLKGDVLEGEAEEEHWRNISLSRMAASSNPYKKKRVWKQNKNKRGRIFGNWKNYQECACPDITAISDLPNVSKILT